MPLDGARPPTPAEDSARRAVAHEVADERLSGTGAALQCVCRAAAKALSMRGGTILLVGSAGADRLAASSDPWSAEVAELGFTVGEGPGIDALARRGPVLVADLATADRRWPGYVQAAGEVDLRAVHSFPLLVGAVALGVLELYATEVHTLQDDSAPLALAFSHLATGILLGDQAPGEDGTWEPLVDPRAEIHQAQGMVMVDLGVDLAEALVRMRAHAFTEGIALIDLARAIIAGYTLPGATDDIT
jgi:GAF domain/ANTAR domain